MPFISLEEFYSGRIKVWTSHSGYTMISGKELIKLLDAHRSVEDERVALAQEQIDEDFYRMEGGIP